MPAGGSALEFMDYFLLETDQESELGDIPCVVNLRAGLQAPYYEIDVSIDLSLSLDQYGFSYPSSTMNLRSSPVVGDLNGDGNTGSFEISTRIKDSVRITANYNLYWSVNDKDTLYSFRRDNYLGIKITNYF